MRALTWHGKHDVRVDTVDDPEIVNPRDAIIKITSTAICGSDLHLYDGYIPTLKKGDILGHEFMGEVVETGPKSTLKKGQRVVVPFTIACGSCYHCGKQQFSACDNSNPADNQDIADTLYGQPMSGLFGYTHMTGGYAGGQAEYVRVPFSDVGPIVIPDGVRGREGAVPLRHPADGLDGGGECRHRARRYGGGVGLPARSGLFAIQSAFLMGAAPRDLRSITFPHRLANWPSRWAPRSINYRGQQAIYEALMRDDRRHRPRCGDRCGGPGERTACSLDNVLDQIKATAFLGTERHACRCARRSSHAAKAGGSPMPGVYGGFVDKFPMGAFMEKGLTMKTGQTHVQHYLPGLLNAIMEDKIDTTFLISAPHERWRMRRTATTSSRTSRTR